MAGKAQKNATRMYRRRSTARGLVRLEVQANRKDADLIRALAAVLRENSRIANAARSKLTSVLSARDVRTAFDIFGSDLPDETFEGVFEQPRQAQWRDVKL